MGGLEEKPPSCHCLVQTRTVEKTVEGKPSCQLVAIHGGDGGFGGVHAVELDEAKASVLALTGLLGAKAPFIPHHTHGKHTLNASRCIRMHTNLTLAKHRGKFFKKKDKKPIETRCLFITVDKDVQQ